MNERIRQLMAEADRKCSETRGIYDEILAELIIQECLDQLHVGDTDEDYDKGAYWSREQIKNHFGVEE